MFGVSISILLRNAFLFVGAVVMMVITSPKLSILVLVAIPLIVFPLILSGRGVRRRSRAAQDRLADASAYAAEAIGAIRTMQAFGMGRATAEHFRQASENAYSAARDSVKARALLTGVAIFLISASVVGVMWYGAQGVLAGTMTAGQLSQFVLYAVFGASALGQLSEVYGELAQAAGAAERLGEILAAEPAIRAPAEPKLLPVPPRGEVAFESVRLTYPTRPEHPSLDGISFQVAHGERVALVGPSGAGKTTVLQALLRFYDPQSGIVRVDGIDIASVDPDALRERMSLVPQDPTVFSGSVIENIRYGRPRASEAEVHRAAELAHADASSAPCRRATTRRSASAASPCPAVSASVSPLPAPFSRTRRSCSSTKRPRPSMPRASARCRPRSIRSCGGARPWSSPIGWPRSAPPTASSSSTAAGSSRRERMRACWRRGALRAAGRPAIHRRPR